MKFNIQNLGILILAVMIGVGFGVFSASAQMDVTTDIETDAMETADQITDESDFIEGIETDEGPLGLDPAKVYDVPGEEYEDIEEDYEEEMIEEEDILDEDYYEEDEGAGEEIPLEEIDPDELESPLEEEAFESEFEGYDMEEMEGPEEDHTIGTEFEEIDPRELESAPEGVTAQ